MSRLLVAMLEAGDNVPAKVDAVVYWLERAGEGSFDLGPVVILTRRRHDEYTRNAFRLGVDAGAFGLVPPTSEPELRSV